MLIRFLFGTPGLGKIWIDSVSVVVTLAEGPHAAGIHTAQWHVESVPSGAYFIRPSYAGRTAGKTVLLAR